MDTSVAERHVVYTVLYGASHPVQSPVPFLLSHGLGSLYLPTHARSDNRKVTYL